MMYGMFSVKIFKRTFLICIASLLVIMLGAEKIWAEENEFEKVPTRYGIGITSGQAYDPGNNITFLQLNAFALYDYDRVWRHKAPEPLRFKVECNLGATINSPHRAVSSVNMLALYYLDNFSNSRLRPYVEAGIGIIYTDFRVENQGLRFNFNPQLGIGVEFLSGSKPVFYTAIRTHHVSNGGLRRESNRGINSIVVIFGRFF
ncbi:MAG: acyloxyacyl hydrolase [Candidatus Omnitrophota bacterium]